MARGPRDYDAGTQRALFRVAEGTCYFPGCQVAIIAVVEGHPVVAVEVAHICGAKDGSARYDPAMTDEQRAAFDNLVLLCTSHHKLVDRIEPEKYPVEALREWKAANEPGGLAAMARQVTAANLEAILEQVVEAVGPTRRVEVDLLAGIVVSPGDIMTFPFEARTAVLAATAT
jgi:hypothetical protein